MARPRLPKTTRVACWTLVVCAAASLVSCQRTGPAESGGPAASDTPNQNDASGVPRSVANQVPPPEDLPKLADREFISPLAGTWYDADRQALIEEIDGYLSQVTGKPLEDVCALILPHAGYRYSGPTAAYALHQVQGRLFQRVVVIGPSHRVPLENMASVPDFTHYTTPLGRVPLDVQFLAKLRKYPEFQSITHAHEGEHSVQIELPLLQQILGDFQFVPIIVGDLDRSAVRRIGRILRGLVDAQTLVVASSDFTHYGDNYGYVPFTEDVPENLKKLDEGAIEQLCHKNVDGLFDYIDKTGATICGRCAIAVLLSMLPADAKVHALHYETSGQMVGDYSNSVSYVAAAVTGKWKPVPAAEPSANSQELSVKDKERLLKLARGSLTYVLEHWEMPTPEQLNVEITSGMEGIAGVFVTLHKHGELRGCIGEIFPSRPLYKGVMTQAVNAGLKDYRFPQVEPAELDEIDFEISVLTPPRSVPSVDEIVIGRHGVVLKKAGSSAVFLPKVAVEQGWDLETMLAHLSQKAGLPADAWREGATFDVFEAIVFGEKKQTKETPATQSLSSGVD